MNKFLYGILCSSALTVVSMGALAETYTDAKPLSSVVGKSFADCHTQSTLRCIWKTILKNKQKIIWPAVLLLLEAHRV